MEKKFKQQIEMLLELGIQDIMQHGQVSIREIAIKPDGTETVFPPPGTNGVSLNLQNHSARMYFKREMQVQVENDAFADVLLLYDNMITTPSDLLENPNSKCLYVLCMTANEKMVVKQDYTIDETGKPVFVERIVFDHDLEESQLAYGIITEILQSCPDKDFEAIPEKLWVQDLPKEWVDYVRRERQNRDSDEWISPVAASLPFQPLPTEEDDDEVFDLEETV